MEQAATAGSVWHIEQRGERRGPFPEAQIRTLIEQKELGRTALCWQPGMGNWQPLENTVFKDMFANEPPPLTATAVPNGLVWALVFAPILGVFISAFIFGITATPMERLAAERDGSVADKYWWLTVVLNIGLSLLDERRLKKAGYDTREMGASWLVPVYLYKRARVLGQKPVHFVGWMICFIASFFL